MRKLKDRSIQILPGTEPIMITVEQACAYLNLGTQRVYELIESGQMPARREGRVYRIPFQALKEWANDRSQFYRPEHIA